MDADDYVLRKDNCREDFIAGAEWRINSVWHDAKEVIIKSGYILVEFKTKRSVSYNIWKIERADVVSYWNVFMAENKIITKKCTDKYEYIYLPKDPFKKHPNKKGECYLIRRGEV